MAPIQMVWFKRDTRIRDHWPLLQACRSGAVLAMACDEPSLQQQPDYSARHRGFMDDSLNDLAHELGRLGVPLWRWPGEVLEALTLLRQHLPLAGLWSHEETGNLASYARDRAVLRWCREHGVGWQEFPQFGVVRRLPSRDDWHQHWESTMQAAVSPLPREVMAAELPPALIAATAAAQQALSPNPASSHFGSDAPARQRGGRREAVAVLTDFLQERCTQYRGGISSPLRAPTACSRLSPYLAAGNLSMREVVQATRRRMLMLAEQPDPNAQRTVTALRQFESRLHWHCHFIQKLESEPALEQRCMHPGYEGLRANSAPPAHLAAWMASETGYPLIDACMAMLQHTGWLNFRMRAMLVSFASYNLWLDWPQPAWHLARLFTDYEPGIHYPQIQMQSGVTGINTLRIYNPVKQAQDHDPHGHFVRRWLPALRRVPDAWVFQPWLMPPGLQQQCGVIIGRDYPAPIVDFDSSYRLAKARFSEWRQQPNLKAQARAVYERHGSRAGPQRRNKRPPTRSTQLDLFS
jgi:deoxyribodipyrimidine photo-lyase